MKTGFYNWRVCRLITMVCFTFWKEARSSEITVIWYGTKMFVSKWFFHKKGIVSLPKKQYNQSQKYYGLCGSVPCWLFVVGCYLIKDIQQNNIKCNTEIKPKKTCKLIMFFVIKTFFTSRLNLFGRERKPTLQQSHFNWDHLQQLDQTKSDYEKWASRAPVFPLSKAFKDVRCRDCAVRHAKGSL